MAANDPGTYVDTPAGRMAAAALFYWNGSAWVAASAPGPVLGTTTNDNAAAGFVGEFISSSIGTGSPVSMVSATAKTVTSISLTAGDWDVWGNVVFVPNVATTVTRLAAGISIVANTDATAPAGGARHAIDAAFNTGAGSHFLPTGTVRMSLAATTTVFLIGTATFAVNIMGCSGFLGARRVR